MAGPKVPEHMEAVLLTAHGGLDMLDFRDDVPVPRPGPGEVLIAVAACGMNNTDINTRIGWYSKNVTRGTTGGDSLGGLDEVDESESTWGGAGVRFPRVQGADVVGCIVATGGRVAQQRRGERVLVDPWLRDPDDPGDRSRAGYLGSERDGGYAQYAVVPAVNAQRIDSTLSDPELATFPCSYSTAEYILTRARLQDGETLLITGASGGVGSALVQLARRRGARVIAIAGAAKVAAVSALGADHVVARDATDPYGEVQGLTDGTGVDVVADVVGGAGFARLLELLRRGGRYVTSGAIAGPMVELDLRTLYLNDLEMHGATVMPADIFPRLIGYIERGEIRPLLAETFPLRSVREAQQRFVAKQHVGNLVLLPG